jgi:adenylate kinase family enzyme
MFILLGLPGSGKSVQSDLLKHRKSIYHIAPGIALRKLAASSNNKELQELLTTGGLVDDKMVANIIHDEIKKTNGLFVIEGYPRTIDQITSFKNILQDEKGQYIIKKVIVLDVSPEIITQRLYSRKVCGQCHKSFQNFHGNCDVCNVPLTVRSDDNQEAIQKRIQLQGNYLKEILDYFKKEKISIEILDGKKSIEDIFKDIENVIENSL